MCVCAIEKQVRDESLISLARRVQERDLLEHTPRGIRHYKTAGVPENEKKRSRKKGIYVYVRNKFMVDIMTVVIHYAYITYYIEWYYNRENVYYVIIILCNIGFYVIR